MVRFIMFFLTVLLVSCQQNRKVPVPDDHWPLFDSAAFLSSHERSSIEGVYAIEATDAFGALAALKWSYTVKDRDTVYKLSMFCEKDISYFICEGRRSGDSILLDGYWRKLDNDKTGKARFILAVDSTKKYTVADGAYGEDKEGPSKKIRLTHLRPLYNKTPLEIIAHRGGGRITDFIPSSENSVELIQLAPAFGATGVEIDVQLTKDSVPILYHDANINDRLTQKVGVLPPPASYSYTELKEIKLKKGEQIPTLDEALSAVVHNTDLKYVWIDAKKKNSLPAIRALQIKFTKEAERIGRKTEITIGIHEDKVFEGFLSLADYKNIPSACELDTDKVKQINAPIWAPIWTDGLQQEKVDAMHAEGRRAFTWTVDKPKDIFEFITEGKYDGIVTNFPSLVAYFYYTREAPRG